MMGVAQKAVQNTSMGGVTQPLNHFRAETRAAFCISSPLLSFDKHLPMTEQCDIYYRQAVRL